MAIKTVSVEGKSAVERKPFNLEAFLPYMLNQVAEAVSKSFEDCYQKDFGLTRTQWRIVAHLYAAGGLTAKEICARTHEDKVSVSRGVSALEGSGRLQRRQGSSDRRYENLGLTDAGRELFEQLIVRAQRFEAELERDVGAKAFSKLREALEPMMSLPKNSRRDV